MAEILRESATLGLVLGAMASSCSPATSSGDPGTVGAAGAVGPGGAVGTGGAVGAGGSAANSGAPGAGGSTSQAGAAGMPSLPPPFSTLPGVTTTTPLDQLAPSEIVQACGDFEAYFKNAVPDADVVRGQCVHDAVFNKGATTVAQCQQVSAECIGSAAPPPPLQCVAPSAGFTCPATLASFDQCATDLTLAEKNLYALLVCESLDDPAIQTKYNAALATPPSCIAFAQTCPSFFPTPTGPGPGPDASAP